LCFGEQQVFDRIILDAGKPNGVAASPGRLYSIRLNAKGYHLP